MKTLIEKGIELSSSELANTSKDLLTAGYKIRFRVTGKSMVPVIVPGDLLTVAPIEGDNIRLGQIVMIITDQGRTIVHRLVSLHAMGNKNFIQTCGDNASVKDKPVEKQQVLGRIIEIQRGGKRVDSSRFLNRIRAFWYLLRAQRIPSFIEKENERDEQFSQDL